MQTRLQSAFNSNTFNECGMMTRNQKRNFEKIYGKTALKVQENKRVFSKPKEKLISFIKQFIEEDWSKWLSPSRFYHYFVNDEFSYILEDETSSTTKNHSSFQNKLMQEGKEFEDRVFSYYRDLFEEGDVVYIGDGLESVRDRKCMERTKQAIRNGTPLILQGVLWDEKRKCYGMADMIVRSDVISKLVFHVDDTGFDVKAPYVPAYHYRVIDVKSSTLDLRLNGHLGTTRNQKYYQAQVGFYNQVVSNIQGYDPKRAYILGKRTKQGVSVSSRFNETLGIIDFTNYEVYKELDECINWIRKARKMNYEDLFTMPLPLPDKRLYPNMCKNITEKKTLFADHIQEISSLYYCGHKQRERVHSLGIYKRNDSRLTPNILGFNGETTRSKCIEADLHLARNPSLLLLPESLSTNFFRDREYIASVDFEFINEPDYSAFPIVRMKKCVFMIGFSLRTKTFSLKKVFTAPSLTYEGEKQMMVQFLQYMRFVKISNCFLGPLELFHWNHTELTEWNDMRERHPELLKMEVPIPPDTSLFEFIDMKKVFMKEPIMIQDTHGFRLKQVVKKLVDYGLMDSSGWEGMCQNGEDVLSMIKEAEKEAITKECSLEKIKTVQEIEKYNLVDCEVLLDLYDAINAYYK